MLRFAAAALFVLVAGAQVARTALLSSSGASSSVAQSTSPEHPQVLTSTIMAAVGAAAAKGEEPGAATLRQLERLAVKEPLAPEPLLVHGAIAVRGGDYRRAEALLVEARRRAPRSPAGRYLLADLYLRSGRAMPAMAEMAVLNRLIPASSMQLAPALAAYTATPGALGQVRAILAAYPELEQPLLAQLAQEPKNINLVLALAKPRPSDRATPGWQRNMLTALINAGSYERAYRMWARFAGVKPVAPGLFNPGFQPINAPPPFNWEFARGSGGVAEATSGGLDVLYFGREDVLFAHQTMLLPPGRYRLAMQLNVRSGDPRSSAWRVTCLRSRQQLLELPLSVGSRSGPLAGDFTVPGGCPAQRIELRAVSKEFPEQADFRIAQLRLAKAGGQ